MTRLFFYGLFMDEKLLAEMGLNPRVVGPARLDDFELRIGQKAALVPTPGARSFGLLIDLPEAEVEKLYSQPGVAEYRPEEVDAVLLTDGSHERSVCYNLPAGKLGSKLNQEYVESLARLVLDLGLPEDYARRIRERCGV